MISGGRGEGWILECMTVTSVYFLQKKMKERAQFLSPVDAGDIDKDVSVEDAVDVEDGYVSDGDRDVVEPPPPPAPRAQ